jgi:hypothetical protein
VKFPHTFIPSSCEMKEDDGLNLQQPPRFLKKCTYEKIKLITEKNEIDFDEFLTELYIHMLNHHKNEVEEIIKNLKKVKKT